MLRYEMSVETRRAMAPHARLAAFSPPEMGDPLRSMFETRW